MRRCVVNWRNFTSSSGNEANDCVAMRSNLVAAFTPSRPKRSQSASRSSSTSAHDYKGVDGTKRLLFCSSSWHDRSPIMKQKVLFICVQNSTRSQMAEAFLKEICGHYFEPHSAGLEPGTLNPLAVEAMREIGIDISQNQTRSEEHTS